MLKKTLFNSFPHTTTSTKRQDNFHLKNEIIKKNSLETFKLYSGISLHEYITHFASIKIFLFKRELMKRTEWHLLFEIKKWSAKSKNCLLHIFFFSSIKLLLTLLAFSKLEKC